MNEITVLVVDDSSMMRNFIGRIIESDHSLILVAKARDGIDALQKIEELKPDVITLDIEMPRMDGISFLKELKNRSIDTPVIIISSVTTQGAAITIEALTLGASDFITKPSGPVSINIKAVGDELIELIKIYTANYRRIKNFNDTTLPFKKEIDRPLLDKKRRRNASTDHLSFTNSLSSLPIPSQTGFEDWPLYRSTKKNSHIDIIAIAISTGGPNVLREIVVNLNKDLPIPIVIVQHMPASFTLEFSKSLNRISPLKVKEAEQNDVLTAGTIYIAPGDYHMTITQLNSTTPTISLNKDKLENGHRPSADILFASLVESYGARSLAIIMTGMGRDGARQIGELHNKGAITIAQDKESCIVFGMPKIAIEAGYIDKVLNPQQIITLINQIATGTPINL